MSSALNSACGRHTIWRSGICGSDDVKMPTFRLCLEEAPHCTQCRLLWESTQWGGSAFEATCRLAACLCAACSVVACLSMLIAETGSLAQSAGVEVRKQQTLLGVGMH